MAGKTQMGDLDMTREEAIKIANEMYGWLKTDREKEALETLVPELRESEDNKIAEELIKALRGISTGLQYAIFLTEEKKQRWISWLEKQKDVSKAIEAVDRIDKYIDEHLANAHDMKDSNPDKKYYRGWDDALGKMSGILQDVYSGEKQKEQPKEELVYRLNGLMQDYIKEGKDEAEKEHRFKCYQLFWDALEDTSYFEQKEQKPAEWSEEDEDNLKAIIRIIEDNDSDWKELTDWLKSLRPQPYWKPSEEQMEALFTVLEHEAEREGPSKALEIANGFYDNLQKLM